MMKSMSMLQKIGLGLLIIVSLITLSLVGISRSQVEKSNNQVEIVLNYAQIAELAQQSDEEVSWWLKKFKGMGATSSAIVEETLINYLASRFIYYEMSGNIVNDEAVMATLPVDVQKKLKVGDDYDLVIRTTEKAHFKRVYDGLSRYEALVFTAIESDDGDYIIVDRDEEDLVVEESNAIFGSDGRSNSVYKKIVGTNVLELPIGFNENIVEIINHAGLDVLLRPINNSGFSGEMLSNYQDEINRFAYANPVPLLLSAGADVLGFVSSDTDYVKETHEFLEANGYSVALIESNVQRQYKETYGLDQLVESYDEDKFVRLFTMWPYIQERYIYPGYSHGEEIGNSMYRAITERNIRVIHFNPFMWNEEDYVTEVKDYELVFKELQNRLGEHGYSFGRFSVLDNYHVSIPLRVLLYSEVVLFGLILLNLGLYKFSTKYNVIFTCVGLLGAIATLFVAPNMSLKLFGLLASVIFSSLAAVVYHRVCLCGEGEGNFFRGIGALVLSGGIALAGGVYVGTIMARTDYFLEIELFTGVKLSLLAPIAIAVFYMILAYIKKKVEVTDENILVSLKEETLGLLDYSIQIKHVMIFGIVAVAGYIYLARSGHESGVQPMQLEIIMRNFLERSLFARPRNKEFLIAFPAVILGVTFKDYFKVASLEIKYIIHTMFVGLGVIGFSSVTNTFSHLRTPIYLSFTRTLISIASGIVVAFVLMIAIRIMMKLVSLIIRQLKVKLKIQG